MPRSSISSINSSIGRPNQTGFTLIELLVAISILAIIAVLGWRGLDSIVRARIGLTTNLEQTRGMQLAFAQLQSDCDHIAAQDQMEGRPRIVVQQNKLILTRTIFVDNQPSQLQIVTYRIKDEQLLRHELGATRDFLVLEGLLRAAINDTDDDIGQSVVLQSGITSMEMRFWAGRDGWQSPREDRGTDQVRHATGLEVRLQLRDVETTLLKVFLLGAM